MKQRILIGVTVLVFLCVYSHSTRALPEGAVARLGLGEIHGVAFSPDGKMIAVAAELGVGLYSIGFDEIAFFETNVSMYCVAFSPDGSLLAGGGSNKALILWDVKALKESSRLRGHSTDVVSVAFSPDRNLLASGSSGEVIIWDVTTGQEATTIVDCRSNVVFNTDGDILASLTYNNRVKFWDINNNKEINIDWQNNYPYDPIAFGPDRNLLAAGSRNTGDIKLWENYKEITTFEGHSGYVNSITFSSDSNTLASCGDDRMVILWDIKNQKEITRLKGHLDTVNSIAFSPNGNLLISGSSDGTAILWDVKNAKEVNRIRGHVGAINSIAFNSDGSIIASSSASDRTIIMWDVKSKKSLATLGKRLDEDSMACVAFNPDGNLLAAGGFNEIRLWDAVIYKEVVTLTGHSGWVTSIAFSPNGEILASNGEDGLLILWDVKSMKRVSKFPKLMDNVSSFAFSPDGSLLAIMGREEVKLWDMKLGKEIPTPQFGLPESLGEIYSFMSLAIAFNPDGNLLAIGEVETSRDSYLILTDVKNDKLIASFKLLEFYSSIENIALSPDGKLLVGTIDSNTINVWDVTSGKEVATLAGHLGEVTSIAFSPDGSLLASGGDDASILLWSAPEPTPDRLLSIGEVTAMKGKEIIVPISVTNAAGIAAADITVTYDEDIIRIKEVKTSTLTTGWGLTANIGIPEKIIIAMAGNSIVPSGEGTLVEMVFTVNINAKLNIETRIEFSSAEIYNANANKIPIAKQNGKVKILDCVKGDVSGDGKVNSADAILVLRIAAGLLAPSSEQMCAADMNNDNAIKSNDALLILRKVSEGAPAKQYFADSNGAINVTFGELSRTGDMSILAPIEVDKTDILAGGDISIAYDNTALCAVDVLSNADVLMESDISKPGIIRIAFLSADKLSNNTIATIKFNMLKDYSSIAFGNIELYSSDALPLKLIAANKKLISLLPQPEYSALMQNYPNPFNPETWIPYQLNENSEVYIWIYNISGEVVRELALGYKPAGIYVNPDRSAYWDGKNESGELVSSGVYFYNIKAGDFSSTKKMIVKK